MLARQRKLDCGLSLRACGCDDYAACEDEQAADEDCERWELLECQPRGGLSGEKEKHHVEAEEFAEVPGRRVDSPSAGEQDDGRECQQRGLLPGQSFVKSRAEQCVSAKFSLAGPLLHTLLNFSERYGRGETCGPIQDLATERQQPAAFLRCRRCRFRATARVAKPRRKKRDARSMLRYTPFRFLAAPGSTANTES